MVQTGLRRLTGRLGRAGLAVVLLLASAPALAANEVIGKIEAKMDGKAMTWYVLKTVETGDPGVIWMSREGSQPRAFIAGFESKDVKVGKDANGLARVTGDGSMMSLTFDFDEDADQVDYQLPTMGADPASVMFVPVLDDLGSMYMLPEGRITISHIAVDGDNGAQFSGSFSGTLHDKAGDTHELTDGRFDVSGGRHFQPPADSGR